MIWFSCNWLHYKIDPKKNKKHCLKTLFVHIVGIASVSYFCYCSTEVQMYCLLLFPHCLLLTWSIFFSKEMDDAQTQTHFENPYYGWLGLVLVLFKVSNFKPETCIPVLGSCFQFWKTTNSSSPNISKSKNHWFSSLKKINPESKNYWFQSFQKTSKNQMIFI